MTTLAERIALDLMTTGGINERLADSLQLHTLDGKYLGGWTLHTLTQRIEKHLRGEFSGSEYRGRCQYQEARIEKLSLHNGHVLVKDGGVHQRLHEWAESVMRGDDSPPE